VDTGVLLEIVSHYPTEEELDYREIMAVKAAAENATEEKRPHMLS
jgi:hypothetical protein